MPNAPINEIARIGMNKVSKEMVFFIKNLKLDNLLKVTLEKILPINNFGYFIIKNMLKLINF